jgi:hypothetical protein
MSTNQASPVSARFALLRPLAEAHWSLPCLVVITGLALTFAQPCRSGPYYAEVAWAVLVACIVLWTNHVRRAPLNGLRVALRVLTGAAVDGAKLLLIWFLAAFPLAVITPTYQCYTDRAKAAEVLLAGVSMRDEVAANVQATGTTTGAGRGIRFTPTGRVGAGFVSEDGNVVLIGSDPPVAFLMTPSLKQGAVTWRCQGFPEKSVPMMCRGPAK